MTFERTSFAAPVVACTTGMKTPRTSSVTSTLAAAANDGIGLRRIERSDSRTKNPRPMTLVLEQRAELGGRLGRVEARRLVADDLALRELDHAPAHPVDHRVVVRGDEHRRAGLVDPVEQLHDPDRR